jgi:hypothetical protein
VSDGALISIVALVGWLVVAGSAFASYRLGWSKILQIAVIWVAIFAGLFVIADFFGAALPN